VPLTCSDYLYHVCSLQKLPLNIMNDRGRLRKEGTFRCDNI